MTDILPELQSHSIVLVGDFNPPIFQPAWMAAHNLIREAEAQEAEIGIVHKEVIDFRIDWLRFQVTHDRLTATSTQEPFFEPLRDLVQGIFGLLKHTPLRMMGLNREMHFKLAAEGEWHAMGDVFVPKDIWADLLDHPGMRRLNIQARRKDNFKGSVNVRVEPSQEPILYGVAFSVNDHFEIQRSQGSNNDSEEIVSILTEQWASSMQDSKKLIYSLLERSWQHKI